jgi:hypothetical protein
MIHSTFERNQKRNRVVKKGSEIFVALFTVSFIHLVS